MNDGLAQPATQFNVKSHGAAGDGAHLDTDAINKTIEAASEAGGGTVLIPAGVYLTGTVLLQGNVTLWLDAGATILGSTNLSDYRWPKRENQWSGAIILADGAQHVAIMGRGTIDGQNLTNPNGEERIRGPHAVLFYHCNDVIVRDVTFKDAGNYSLILRSCEQVNIDDMTALGGYDGINMHDVRTVSISNCKLYTGDDCLAGTYWENVTVCNCLLNSSCNAIRAGGRNVLINNCVIYGPGKYVHRLGLRHDTEAGFQILPQGPSRSSANSTRVTASGPVDNMILSDITMINVRTPVYVAYGTDAPYSGNNAAVGRIIIDNLTATDCGRTPFYVSASTNHPAKSIIVRNARMTFIGGVEEEEANGQGFSPYSMLPSYGLYCRNVEDLELHDVRVGYRDMDRRPALFGENIGTLELDRFVAQREADGAPSLIFKGVGKLIINGAQAAHAKITASKLEVPPGGAVLDEPFFVATTVHNEGQEGLAELELQLGNQEVKRSVWLGANEMARVGFVNLRARQSGEIPLRLGNLLRVVSVRPKPSRHPVSVPFLSFQNLTGVVQQIEGGFYIQSDGDYAVMDHGDQYAAAYLPHAMGESNSAVVRLENPDNRSNWLGRTGLMVRKDISQPGQSPGYLLLDVSPSNGSALEWDSHGRGRIDQRTDLGGYTDWPCWLKLQRDGTRFTGYSSKDGSHWCKIGDADVPGAKGSLDIGVFAHRSSARFLDFRVVQ
jgi:hypothetical protein